MPSRDDKIISLKQMHQGYQINIMSSPTTGPFLEYHNQATDGFFAQRASYAESISMSWHHQTLCACWFSSRKNPRNNIYRPPGLWSNVYPSFYIPWWFLCNAGTSSDLMINRVEARLLRYYKNMLLRLRLTSWVFEIDTHTKWWIELIHQKNCTWLLSGDACPCNDQKATMILFLCYLDHICFVSL